MVSNTTHGLGDNVDPLEPLSTSGNEVQPDLRPWDTSDPFFSASTRVLLQQVLKCYVRQAVVFVGIPGNVMCCLVFFKHGLSDRINLLLFWLAFTDLGNLLSQVLNVLACYLTDRVLLHNWTVVVDIKISYVSWWLGHLSGILVVIVSVDRCLSVALPLRARRLLGYRPTVTAIVLAYLLSFMVFLPAFLTYTLRWETDPSTNRSLAFSDGADWFPLSTTEADNIIYYSFVVTLPVFLSIMIVCCTITILNLRQASRQRLKMTGNVTEESKAGQNRITVMLLVICAVYMVLALPETVFAVLVMLLPGLHIYEKYHNTVVVVYQFIWIGTCLNSAINFFVYVVLSSRFQKTLKNSFASFFSWRV